MPLPALLLQKEFNCATLSESANYFIKQGATSGVSELVKLAERENDEEFRSLYFSFNDRLTWLCRMLFISRTGTPLRDALIGGHMLPHLSKDLKKWPDLKECPYFPLYLSGNSFFVLGQGRMLGGRAEPMPTYLRYCQSLGTFRTRLLPVTSREQALKDAIQLRESPFWKKILWESKGQVRRYRYSEEWVWGHIIKQAQAIP